MPVKPVGPSENVLQDAIALRNRATQFASTAGQRRDDVLRLMFWRDIRPLVEAIGLALFPDGFPEEDWV